MRLNVFARHYGKSGLYVQSELALTEKLVSIENSVIARTSIIANLAFLENNILVSIQESFIVSFYGIMESVIASSNCTVKACYNEKAYKISL